MDDADAAGHLEAAMRLVDTHMTSGPAKVSVLARLGLEAARLRREARARTCSVCARAYIWAIAEQRYDLTQHLGPPHACPSCRAATGGVTRVCRRCSATFAWTRTEQQWFEQKGFDAPRHCPDCREARRREKAASGPLPQDHGA